MQLSLNGVRVAQNKIKMTDRLEELVKIEQKEYLLDLFGDLKWRVSEYFMRAIKSIDYEIAGCKLGLDKNEEIRKILDNIEFDYRLFDLEYIPKFERMVHQRFEEVKDVISRLKESQVPPIGK